MSPPRRGSDEPIARRRRVVIVGGGLTGLATAWHLRDDVEVVLLEASDRLGGQVSTTTLAGVPLDVGADAFLARQPEGEALARAAGFGDDDLVTPATSQVYLWVRGRLRPFPTGTVMGVPTDLRAVRRSGVISPGGVARAGLEPALPRRTVPGDRSVSDLVGERFGREVVDVLVEPLLGGVYAGSADRLSALASIPAVWHAARQHRSLTAGLLAHRRRTAADDRPVFLTVRGGLGRLVDRLAADLRGSIRTGVAVTGLAPLLDDPTDAAWRVTGDGLDEVADAVVLCVPATAAARLLVRSLPEVARELSGIRTASVAVIAFGYDPADVRAVPAGSGFLVPRTEGRLVKAATWTSRKWPHQAGHDRFLLRASVGRVDDRRALELDDDELAERADAEVRWATGIRAPAREREVVRWSDALPQYDVGHQARVDRIRVGVAEASRGLHLGGASFDGVGIAARAREAVRLADAVRAPAKVSS